jgi:hypothetical protein
MRGVEEETACPVPIDVLFWQVPEEDEEAGDSEDETGDDDDSGYSE